SLVGEGPSRWTAESQRDYTGARRTLSTTARGKRLDGPDPCGRDEPLVGRAFIAMMRPMRGRIGAGARLAIVGGLLLPLASGVPRAHAGPPGSPPVPRTSSPSTSMGSAAPSPPPAPRGYLIHLIDGSDPIVVKGYVEEGDQIRFEKLGGWIGIPRYE